MCLLIILARHPFRYSIDRHTDLERLFNIDSTNGTITTLKALDREMSKWHNISVVATEISKGSFANSTLFSGAASSAFSSRPLQIIQAKPPVCPCSSKCSTSMTTRRSLPCLTTHLSARMSKLDRYVTPLHGSVQLAGASDVIRTHSCGSPNKSTSLTLTVCKRGHQRYSKWIQDTHQATICFYSNARSVSCW